jgi:sigma-B regulation protein RsbU (phosphoserine phosphatase)
MRNGKVGIVVGDVSGHGFPSALLMAETLACLRALALAHDDLSEILTLTNAMLLANSATDYFVTVFIACVQPEGRSLAYAGAGHDAFLLHAAGSPGRLRGTGPPLGVAEGVIPQAPGCLALEDGDVLVIVTDGIVEARSRGGEQFGAGRTIEAVTANRTGSAREMVDGLARRVRVFSGRKSQEDDMTAVIVKVTGQGACCRDELVTQVGAGQTAAVRCTGERR